MPDALPVATLPIYKPGTCSEKAALHNLS